jgi:hypothetical protein
MRSHDIALFSICIVEQGYTSRSIGVVFYRCYPCRDISFLTLEVYDAVTPFVSTTTVATCYTATGVATPALLERSN